MFAWTGEGAPQPIRRLVTPDGPEVVLVVPAPETALRIVDTALVGGRPTLAFVRTRYNVPECLAQRDEGWRWCTAQADLVVRDLATGQEGVVRTQDVSWEYSAQRPSLGDGLVAEAVQDYSGGYETVFLIALDGAPVVLPYAPPGAGPYAPELLNWCGTGGCSLVADLPPQGSGLAFAKVGDGPSIDVVLVDRSPGDEAARASLPVPVVGAHPAASAVHPATIDTVDGHVLVGLVATEPAAGLPATDPGDEAPWAWIRNPVLLRPDGFLEELAVFRAPLVGHRSWGAAGSRVTIWSTG